MTDVEDLKADLKKAKPSFGLNTTLKKLRTGQTKKVYVSKDCKDKEAVLSYASKHHIPVVQLEQNNIELGVLCKKPFSVSILSFD